jgi:hypothetical protein
LSSSVRDLTASKTTADAPVTKTNQFAIMNDIATARTAAAS